MSSNENLAALHQNKEFTDIVFEIQNEFHHSSPYLLHWFREIQPMI